MLRMDMALTRRRSGRRCPARAVTAAGLVQGKSGACSAWADSSEVAGEEWLFFPGGRGIVQARAEAPSES